MKIVVIGAGGVGGYFGGRLAYNNHNLDVTFIARGKHLQTIQKNGLQINSIKGNFTVTNIKTTTNFAILKNTDYILLAVKAWQIEEIAHQIQPYIHPNITILPLQNGIEPYQKLIEILDKKYILGGMCKILSHIEEPGKINHSGAEPFIALGELDNKITPRVKHLHQLLTDAEILAKIPKDIEATMWGKFLFITAVSGLGAITRTTLDQLYKIPQTKQMLEQLMTEVYQVALGHKIKLCDNIIEQTMDIVSGLVPGATASMQRDIMAGRPSELEAQNGSVLRLGEKVSVKTPLHRFIYHSLLPMEMAVRQQQSR